MKAPFKVLYSNDLTHILSCVSPYHRRGEDFTKAMLDASVDETADTGIDVHMLQPGFGWVPLWQSEILPPQKQWDWLRKTYSLEKLDSIIQYLLDGGDIVADFTKRCRSKKLTPFISFRLNDTHHLDRINGDVGCAQINFCEFYYNHPEYRLETASCSWRDRGQNWAIDEVREYKLNFIKELCENYDIDGIELDFMRYPYLFRSYETTSEQRKIIVTEFVARVRQLLNETATHGKRWLCVKFPANYQLLDEIGIDPQRLAAAGADMFNLSYYFYTAQNGDLERIRQFAPETAMYVEMTNCTSVGRAVEKSDGDTFEFMKTTSEQFYTTVSSACAAGMDGVSLFNFVYYREHGSAARKGTVSEPPFEIIRHFRDPEFLSRQSPCYFIGSHWQDDGPLPKSMMLQGQYANFIFRNVFRPTNGTYATLKVHIDNPDAGDWEAWFNDRPVFKSTNTLEIAPESRLGGETLIWDIPLKFIRKGDNHIEFRSKDTEVSIIDFIELTIGGEK